MDVILVRHAAAEERRAQTDDLSRRLTSKGRQDFSRSIPRLKKRVDPNKRMAIWTSPAARALQTAQLIADALKIKDITRFDWIYTGDIGAFGAELVKADEKVTLFVVGHQPHLSIWAGQLSGAGLRFKKGAMACFAFPGTASLKTAPRWLIRASMMKDDSMPGRRVSIDDFKQAMVRTLLDVKAGRDRFLKKPNDAESVHQLRVSLRQARSLLLFIKPAVDGGAYGSAQAELKAGADKLSYIRGVDVLLAQRRAFLREYKPAFGCKALAKLLKSRREEEKAAVAGYLSADSFSDALGGISSWAQRWDEAVQDAARFELFALRRIEKWHQEADDAMKAPEEGGIEKIHSLRIKLKNLHNVRDSVHLPDEEKWMALTPLKQLQRDLGEICDAYASVSILRQMAPALDTQRLRAEAGVLEEYLLKLGGELEQKVFLARNLPGEKHA